MSDAPIHDDESRDTTVDNVLSQYKANRQAKPEGLFSRIFGGKSKSKSVTQADMEQAKKEAEEAIGRNADSGAAQAATVASGSALSEIEADKPVTEAGAVKPKPSKPAPKAKKAAQASEDPEKVPFSDLQQAAQRKLEAAEENTLPFMMNIDFYRGVTKVKEVEGYARAFIEKNFEAPNASYFYIQKWREGLVVEMQMGGGKAYLPNLLAELDANPAALAALPMSGRIMQVRYDDTIDRLECPILPMGQLPPEKAVVIKPSRDMEPYDQRGSKMLVGGIVMVLLGLIGSVASIGAFFLDTSAWGASVAASTRPMDLPAMQMEEISKVAAMPGVDCVAKLEFKAGKWKAYPGYNVGGVCSTDQAAAAQEKNLDMASAVQPAPGDGLEAPVPPGTPGTPAVGAVAPAQPGRGQPAPPPAAVPPVIK